MSLKRRSLRHDLQARVDHQTPRAFDFEGSRWPPQFHYTRPFHDGAGRAEVDFPWDRLNGDPLISNTDEWTRRRLSHDYSGGREAKGGATRAVNRRSARSRTNRTAREQHHRGQTYAC